MILKVYTDGGAKGNPGPASIGMVFYMDGKKIFSHREDIGVKTNNEAEYSAVITAMSKLLPAGRQGKSQIHISNLKP